MRKRIVSILLAVSLILSMVVVPVGAEVAEICPCGCGQPAEQVTWKPWDGESTTGHYYLEGDYVLPAQKTVNSGATVVLDLRGHQLTTETYSRLFLIYGYLCIMDTVGGGGLSAKTSGEAVGGAFQIYYNNGDCGTLELRDVTLMPHKDNKSAKGGGLIYVGTGCTLKLDSCILMGGTSTTSGGALHGAAGSFMEITDSSIFGCSAVANGGSIYSAGTVELENTKIWGGTAGEFGGNLYQNGGSLRMVGCDIAYGASESVGTTKYGGGNLCAVVAATVSVENSKIRDGYASYNGGNVYYTTGQYTFTNTVIRGGVVGLYGANLCAFSDNTTTFESCNIVGDVRFGAGTLNLKGATKIGLRNNGLDLVGGGATVVVNAAELTDGAEIYVESNGVFAEAGAKAEYFKPAIRTGDITVNSDGRLTATQASSGALGGYCPHCGERVRWTQFGNETASDAFDADHNLYSGHYYMNVDTAYLYKLPAGTDFVLDINGRTMVGGQRLFRTTGDNTELSLLDATGGGKLTGKGVNNDLGGVIISSFDGFCLNIFGGQYVYVKHADKTVTSGSVIGVSGNNVQVNIHGGLLDGREQKNTSGNYGGTLFFGNTGTGKSFAMTAGRLLGGNAQYGGNIYLGAAVDGEITGGVLQGGASLEAGGNIRVNGTSATSRSEITIKDCAVLGGSISGNFGGGNGYFSNSNVEIENCYLAGGKAAAGYGGNLSGGGGAKVTLDETVLYSGSAAKGGNLYAASTNGEIIVQDCLVLAGNSTGNGGNIFFNNGFNTISGGKILLGTAVGGGNVHTNAGNQAIAGQYTKILGGVLIAGGSATGNGGNLMTAGITELGALRLVSGSAAVLGSDLYLVNGAVSNQLTMSAGVTGKIGMGVESSLLANPVYGNAISNTICDNLSAEITLEGNYGTPGVLAKEGALYVGGATVVAERNEKWYADAASAVAACQAGEYVKLYTGDILALQTDCAIDLNGQTLTVSGSGTLFGMDSSNAAGKAVWADAASIKTARQVDSGNGDIYFAIMQDNTVTYHRLSMVITDLVLRPSCAGLYYKAAWDCDSVLAAQIEEYGIAVSLADMPGTDFKEDEDTLWASSADGSMQCSVLIENIFTDSATATENSHRGEMPIYATAYVRFKDGTTCVSDRPGVTDDVCYSLHSFMEAADQTIQADRITYRETENRLDAFYEQWHKQGTGDWNFSLIKTPVAPQDDDVTKILILGQSLANDTAHLLYKVLKAERPDEKFLVVNIYRSVGLNEHVVNIKNRAAVYQKYTFTDAGMETTSNVTLTEAVMQDNWDLITFNDATFPTTQAKEFEDGEHQFMIDHIRQYAEPGFKLGYNVTWSDPTSALLYTPDRKAVPANYRENFTKYFDGSRNAYYRAICNNIAKYIEPNDAYDLILYPGTAIQYASETHGVPEADPNRNYDLYRDYVHLSDFGRLIAAYQVYAQYFGLEELTSVNLDMVEANMRATYREVAFGDFILTQQHKDAIIASVNYALKNPNTDPPQTAREPAYLEPLS